MHQSNETQGIQDLCYDDEHLSAARVSTSLSTTQSPRTMQPLMLPPIDFASGKAFLFFPKLPIELRLMVWKDALPCGSRILEILYDSALNKHTGERTDKVLRANLPLPSMLHVCRESREVAVKKYSRLSFQSVPFSCIDPSEDIIYLPYTEQWRTLRRLTRLNHELVDSVQYIGMDSWLFDYYATDIFTYYRGLKEFILVMHENSGVVPRDYEAWRVETTMVSVDPSDFTEMSRAGSWLRYANSAFTQWKKDNPHLEAPSLIFKVKAVSRGGNKFPSLTTIS